MTPRALWFVAGAAAGLYASVKARRAAYRLSVPGVADQVNALGSGLRAFNDELQDGMRAKKRELRMEALDAADSFQPRQIEKDVT